ncbi:winged helix-turn-helix domain-containing protein [Pseudomonas sp. UL073]|uniref:Winged helix-turn-helix domain-containing protein n=1 Tax=Zestomonas insulae TaxID=2809017 RepID=A0ABS2IBF6_9GAMM|nr:winged helix-turn-helix domain-containing protein [Pseudomonas insulae]MBM7059133.1 winged helix-turn-helix domain-containing protein [Pseudomonas insulae]
MNTPVAPLAPEPTAAIASCLVIRTGHGDCLARFYPARYQLVLARGTQEEKVDLGYSGSRLLERLLQEPGTVVSREELMSFAWEDRVVGQGSLNQQIYTLRQVLGDEKTREIIQTLPRRGYMLNPHYLDLPPSDNEIVDSPAVPVPTVPASIPVVPAVPAAPPPATAEPAAPTRRTHWLLSGIVLVVAGITLLVLFLQLYATAHPQDSRARLGATSIRYQEADPGQRDQLIADTQSLAQRMAALATRPVELIISRNADFFEVLCVRGQGQVQWLMVHKDQLSMLDEAQLRGCLP